MKASYYYLIGRHEGRLGRSAQLTARAYNREEPEEDPQARIKKGDRVRIRAHMATGNLRAKAGREGIAIRCDHGRVEILYKGTHMYTRTLAPAKAVEKLPDAEE